MVKVYKLKRPKIRTWTCTNLSIFEKAVCFTIQKRLQDSFPLHVSYMLFPLPFTPLLQSWHLPWNSSCTFVSESSESQRQANESKMAPSSRNNKARTQLKPRTFLVPGSALYSSLPVKIKFLPSFAHSKSIDRLFFGCGLTITFNLNSDGLTCF